MVGTVRASFVAYLVVLSIVALQRLMELGLSRRNSRRAREAGAVEAGASHYPWMVALHSSFLLACALEVFLLERPLIVPLAAVSGLVLVLATFIRYWAIRSLGERWTTRVFDWPDRPLVRTGPYRHLRHPNYLAVALEIGALPLLHSAWFTAVIFTLLNSWVLSIRMQVENEVLANPTVRPRGEGIPQTGRPVSE
jgi:methyltransferase